MTQKSDLVEQAKGMLNAMREKQEVLTSYRIQEAENKMRYDRIKSNADEEVTKLLIEIAQDPEIAGSLDPRTGKANADWAKLLTQSRLQQDPRFIELAVAGKDAEDSYYMAQVKTQDLADQLGTLRISSGLLSSLLNYMGGTAD
jgi:hypothetical protein